MTRTVWAVSTGAYSDYSIEAVFTNEALARAHADELVGQVEEFALLDEAPTRFTVYSMSNDTYQTKPGGEPHEWSYLEWSYNRRLYKRAEVNEWNHGSVRVVGWDQEAVRQAFRDRASRAAVEQS